MRRSVWILFAAGLMGLVALAKETQAGFGPWGASAPMGYGYGYDYGSDGCLPPDLCATPQCAPCPPPDCCPPPTCCLGGHGFKHGFFSHKLRCKQTMVVGPCDTWAPYGPTACPQSPPTWGATYCPPPCPVVPSKQCW
jgi:hypothetical protein